MIDPIKVLRRAWYILWNYRVLWLFGLILAVTAGGGSGGNGGGGNSGYQFNRGDGGNNFQPGGPSGPVEQWFQDFFRPLTQMPEKQLIMTLIWVVVGLLCFFLLIGIIFAIARYVSETAVIRMVNEYEQSDVKVGFRQGWGYGWSRTSWRLFLINLLVNLPALVMLLLMLIIGVIVFFLVKGGTKITAVTGIVGSIGLIGLFFTMLFAVIILEVVLHLLREFFWRACALENLGVMDSLRSGFDLVKRNWKSAGLMWLIMLGVSIAWVVVTILLFFLLIPLYIVMAMPGIIVAGIPALIVYGVTSTFLSTPLAAIVALIIALPLFFLVTFSPLLIVGAWMQIFKSSVWTLTYRDILALGNSAPAIEESAST